MLFSTFNFSSTLFTDTSGNVMESGQETNKNYSSQQQQRSYNPVLFVFIQHRTWSSNPNAFTFLPTYIFSSQTQSTSKVQGTHMMIHEQLVNKLSRKILFQYVCEFLKQLNEKLIGWKKEEEEELLSSKQPCGECSETERCGGGEVVLM